MENSVAEYRVEAVWLDVRDGTGKGRLDVVRGRKDDVFRLSVQFLGFLELQVTR